MSKTPRHAAAVRATHWITTLCFFALLLSGVEILISHPRFYWGEAGNVLTPPLFVIPIPASRATVPTGYGYVLPDQNGWSRALHFQSAWAVVLAGIWYVGAGLWTRHFWKNLAPATGAPAAEGYSQAQRVTYLLVVFFLFPMMIWTGLAMSPAFVSVFPAVVTLLGGQQSARTLHFFTTLLISLFVTGHILMVFRGGFVRLTGAMITGRAGRSEEHA